ncbi:MAG: putative O-antigen acetylase [Ilumatobacteraceae bacterium]|nr:putative O-antigen acetylase [Ilumatobacteraceae bacterium]
MLVVAVTVLASRWMLDPLTQGFVDRAGLAAIGFVANIVFWTRGGYSHLTVPDPLVHFWSLAVEEQFYLVWPLLLWAMARTRFSFIRLLSWTIAVVGAASLAACLVLTPSRQDFAFYWLPTRAWELLAGAAIAVAGPALTRSSAAARTLGAWVGLLAIVVCMLRYGDPTSPGRAPCSQCSEPRSC